MRIPLLAAAVVLAAAFIHPADAKLSSNRLAANGATENRLAANAVTTNRLAANRLAANKLAANGLDIAPSTAAGGSLALRGLTLPGGETIAYRAN